MEIRSRKEGCLGNQGSWCITNNVDGKKVELTDQLFHKSTAQGSGIGRLLVATYEYHAGVVSPDSTPRCEGRLRRSLLGWSLALAGTAKTKQR